MLSIFASLSEQTPSLSPRQETLLLQQQLHLKRRRRMDVLEHHKKDMLPHLKMALDSLKLFFMTRKYFSISLMLKEKQRNWRLDKKLSIPSTAGKREVKCQQKESNPLAKDPFPRHLARRKFSMARWSDP